jgi:hypothetical protein
MGDKMALGQSFNQVLKVFELERDEMLNKQFVHLQAVTNE